MALALAEPSLSLGKFRAVFDYLDYLKSKFERLAAHIMNAATAFFKLSPLLLASIGIYAFCMSVGFIMWIAKRPLLDLQTSETDVLEAVIHIVMKGLDELALPAALQLLNGLLAILMLFSILLGLLNIKNSFSVSQRRSRINRYKMNSLFSRSKMIRTLPKTNYGCLRISDDSFSLSCAVCLRSIVEEDGIRILPNCRHYFHTSCIDRWLLLCPTNSSCPLCRATVISNGLTSQQAQ